MAKKYHINPDTHEVGVCSARIKCKFGDDSPHYENVIEAHDEAERQLEGKFDTFSVNRPMNVGMHASHCCDKHGCKYNNENCPVEKGEVKPEFSCEHCDSDEEDRLDPEEFQKDFPVGEPLSDHVKEGDSILYKDEVIIVENFTYNRAILAYEIEDIDGNITEIPDDDWYENSRIKLYGKNEVMKDPEDFQKDFVAGKSFGEQVDVGDQFSYDGEVYKVKDYHYNSPLLQYEIKTNKGDVEISDNDWYFNSDKIKLLGENDESEPLRDVDDFTKSTTPGYDGGSFEEELKKSGQFYYRGQAYKLKNIEYDYGSLEYYVTTDQGSVYIPDDDWYHDSKVKILPNDF